ncbi:hypothetical protein RHGRI_000270 [Rhododendron griersonianum]|uniref:Uncharacterized protein n=1 Tax=Rhododendron griersonianum TaxID=479676 RepID=A0AAV6LGD1_9ERIC|nr:hypothetical protein RHGRI_000270 [Rhododendron griersonianum]
MKEEKREERKHDGEEENCWGYEVTISPRGGVYGGVLPMDMSKERRYQDYDMCAQLAIDKYSSTFKEQLGLEFVKVLFVTGRISCFMTFCITFEAKDLADGGMVKTYQTEVLMGLREGVWNVRAMRLKPGLDEQGDLLVFATMLDTVAILKEDGSGKTRNISTGYEVTISPRGGVYGGVLPMDMSKEHRYQDYDMCARLAIDKYSSIFKEQLGLEFVKVLFVTGRISCFMTFSITFEAKDLADGGMVKTYQTKVLMGLREGVWNVRAMRLKPGLDEQGDLLVFATMLDTVAILKEDGSGKTRNVSTGYEVTISPRGGVYCGVLPMDITKERRYKDYDMCAQLAINKYNSIFKVAILKEDGFGKTRNLSTGFQEKGEGEEAVLQKVVITDMRSYTASWNISLRDSLVGYEVTISPRGGVYGGVLPMDMSKEHRYQDYDMCAQLAIDKYSSTFKEQLGLEFVKVLFVTGRISCFMTFCITFEAKDLADGGMVKTYQTEVLMGLREGVWNVRAMRLKPGLDEQGDLLVFATMLDTVAILKEDGSGKTRNISTGYEVTISPRGGVYGGVLPMDMSKEHRYQDYDMCARLAIDKYSSIFKAKDLADGGMVKTYQTKVLMGLREGVWNVRAMRLKPGLDEQGGCSGKMEALIRKSDVGISNTRREYNHQDRERYLAYLEQSRKTEGLENFHVINMDHFKDMQQCLVANVQLLHEMLIYVVDFVSQGGCAGKMEALIRKSDVGISNAKRQYDHRDKEKYMAYLEQSRKTEGYEVTISCGRGVCGGVLPMDMSKERRYQDYDMCAQLAIDKYSSTYTCKYVDHDNESLDC